MLAQGMAEYSAVTALADGVQRVSGVVQDLIGGVDSRVWLVVGVVAVVWIARKIL